MPAKDFALPLVLPYLMLINRVLNLALYGLAGIALHSAVLASLYTGNLGRAIAWFLAAYVLWFGGAYLIVMAYEEDPESAWLVRVHKVIGGLARLFSWPLVDYMREMRKPAAETPIGRLTVAGFALGFEFIAIMAGDDALIGFGALAVFLVITAYAKVPEWVWMVTYEVCWPVIDLWKVAHESPDVQNIEGDVSLLASIGFVALYAAAVGIWMEILWLLILAVIVFIVCGILRGSVTVAEAWDRIMRLRQEADE